MLILSFNRLPCSYILFFTKVVPLKVVHSLKIFQYAKCHVPTLTDASNESNSGVLMSRHRHIKKLHQRK
jgi:hypothetical protein